MTTIDLLFGRGCAQDRTVATGEPVCHRRKEHCSMSTIDNERRIARMRTWISHAEEVSDEGEAHLRFLFYWIAYEAAYQTYQPLAGSRPATDRTETAELRENLHGKLALYYVHTCISIYAAQSLCQSPRQASKLG